MLNELQPFQIELLLYVLLGYIRKIFFELIDERASWSNPISCKSFLNIFQFLRSHMGGGKPYFRLPHLNRLFFLDSQLTVAPSGMFLVTTAPAPTVTLDPILICGKHSSCSNKVPLPIELLHKGYDWVLCEQNLLIHNRDQYCLSVYDTMLSNPCSSLNYGMVHYNRSFIIELNRSITEWMNKLSKDYDLLFVANCFSNLIVPIAIIAEASWK